MDDRELLRRYAAERSEAAMAALVERHMKMVYATAKREAGDDALAEDVTIAVFVILARKASHLSASVPLASWLFTVTRYAARNAVRGERRRLGREAKAVQEMRREIGYREADAWSRVSPELNDALDALSSREREAIFLRYFRDLSIEEAGQELGISPKAAQMRIQRALEKLRSRLAAKGAPAAVAVLAALLLKRSVEAAPTLSSQEISRIALEQAQSPGSSSSTAPSRGATIPALVRGTQRTMTLRTATVAAATAMAVVAGTGALAVAHRNALQRPHVMAQTAPSPETAPPASAPAPNRTEILVQMAAVVATERDLAPYEKVSVPVGAASAAAYDPIAAESPSQVARMWNDFKTRDLIVSSPNVLTLTGNSGAMTLNGRGALKGLPEINAARFEVSPQANPDGTMTLTVKVVLGSSSGPSQTRITARTVHDGEPFVGAEFSPADSPDPSKMLLVLVTPHVTAAK